MSVAFQRLLQRLQLTRSPYFIQGQHHRPFLSRLIVN
ncbi:hypothetical protein ABH944_000738 [Caballeronia udeis]|jgi:hypothetical protein|uniref:Uncharacterized protein n=1 Tax=Caballeronia udeis TaxID=1232866 RepID=A0ABW8MDS5_9BURK